MIAHSLIDISFDGSIPFTNVKLQDPGKVTIVLFSLVLYFTTYTAHSWFRLPKQERSLFDLAVCTTVGIMAMVPTVLGAFSSIGITWKNVSLALGLLLAGAIFGITLVFAMAIAFSLRSNQEMKKLGLGRVPTAAKAFLRALEFFLIPVDIILMTGIVFFHSSFPKPLDTYWWVFVLCSLLWLNIEQLMNLLLCLGPSSVRRAALKRLRRFQGPMDLHEMHYQHIGLELPRQYAVPEVCQLAKAGQTETLRVLLSKGHNPNQQDGRGWTPLMWASAEGHPPTVDLLLAHGADPNVENYLDRTALMYASRYGYISIVKALVEHGADVNHVREFREHPPLLAAAEHDHQEVVSFLVEKGADIFHKNAQGKTALDLAMDAGHGEIAKILRVLMSRKPRNANSDPLPQSLSWIEKELEDLEKEPVPGPLSDKNKN
ncbi:MAG: ankyrin repeat domain-containing protein [Methylobacter sp.]